MVPASVQDRDTPKVIEPERAASPLFESWAALAFGEAATAPPIRCGLELVGRKGFQVGPQRGRVEQTFGVLGRCRRRLVEHEGGTTMARTMTSRAAPFTTANRCEHELMA